ncbi:hypothetical protein [Fimbriiglobus ruber]|uniref:hypothetical protein n=1 Tax=Fimbriiglobus ruber TaxID=1908690 RepID=UPI000B4B6BC6|nr:hypothetical protein [Fimbriiglobus ruber]
MSDQHQRERERVQPVLGDRQVEQDRVIGREGIKGVRQGAVREGLLPVDEPATDVVLVGPIGDRDGSGEGLDRDPLALCGAECVSRAGARRVRVGTSGRGGRKTHACFVHDTGAVITTRLGETGIFVNITSAGV